MTAERRVGEELPPALRRLGSSTALVRGWADTRSTLLDWNATPWPVLRGWLALSTAVSVGLLLAVWCIAAISPPEPSLPLRSGAAKVGDLGDVLVVLGRNGLVLALHAFACVAGFIAGSSLPHQAAERSGLWRRVHERAGPLAIAFVIAATAFSLSAQAYVLGASASTLAAQQGISPGLLLFGLLPHALPELVALFLPLAAWVAASRRGDWHQLLAATFVTVAIAIPMLVLAALVEVFVSPLLISAIVG